MEFPIHAKGYFNPGCQLITPSALASAGKSHALLALAIRSTLAACPTSRTVARLPAPATIESWHARISSPGDRITAAEWQFVLADPEE